MIREIRYKISKDTKSIEPKTRQWAGMQYEDNATEVVFDLSELGLTNAIYRIDFNSSAAGYQPSANIFPESGLIRRSIPKYITQYGGEVQVTAVITLLDIAGDETGEALSYPVIIYFTAVEKSEEGSAKVEGNISEIEQSVKDMYDSLIDADINAEQLAETNRKAEETIDEIERKLESGELKGEKGDPGRDAVTDQAYNPESPNAQSGKAVAESISTKANLDFEKMYVSADRLSGNDGTAITTLYDAWPHGSFYELFFDDIVLSVAAETEEELASMGFKRDDKYRISISSDLNVDCIERVIDLKDKVNIADIDQSYNPESPNAQSGKAVAEAVSTKADLQFTPINIRNRNATWTTGYEGTAMTMLLGSIILDSSHYQLDFMDDFGNMITIAIRAETEEELYNMGFDQGRRYKISMSSDSRVDSISRIIHLYDKVNESDVDITYSPDSPHPQSGIAVAEAVSTKANLDFKEIDISNRNVTWTNGFFHGHESTAMTRLLNIFWNDSSHFQLGFFDDFGYAIDVTIEAGSQEELYNIGLVEGYRYKVSISPDSRVVVISRPVNLCDKVNLDDVDQTYSPESPNAQSGKAVAEAISTVAQKEWELIEDITLTEAVTEIRIPKDKLRFKEIHIESLVIPSDTTITSQKIYVAFTGSQLWVSQANPKSTGKLYFVADLYISPDNKIFCDGNLTANYYTTSSGVSSFKTVSFYFMNDAMNYKYISGTNQDVRVYTSENGFAAGTKFKVWGR